MLQILYMDPTVGSIIIQAIAGAVIVCAASFGIFFKKIQAKAQANKIKRMEKKLLKEQQKKTAE